MSKHLPVLVLSLLSLHATALAAERPATVREPLKFNDGQRRTIAQLLERHDRNYDPAEKMLRSPFSSPGYHTTLKGGQVHSTRSALHYAVVLMDSGEEANRRRAEDILRRVIVLQDKNPASKTYGIWSWFLEEPLDKMSPPDWNWADFCGQALVEVMLDHRDRLPAELAREIDQTIIHAARSIQRRNVGPGYTNISILGTYVTLAAAEMYGLDDLRQYAMNRLRTLHEYNTRQGSFSEYNSPTYTVVALYALAQLRQDVRIPEAQKLVGELYHMAWEEIARHFHVPTRQWAGPHSRCYSTLLRSTTLDLIQRGTAGRVDFGLDQVAAERESYRVAVDCPRDLESLFTRLEEPRMLVKTFVQGREPIIGSTYLHPAFALSSINRGDFWNQRRGLLAYFGTHVKPGYLHVQLLHDGYAFSAGTVAAAQDRSRVLAVVNIATDGGDTHISLDRIKDATIRAKDIRLRFELGGPAGATALVAPQTLREPALIRAGEARMRLAVPVARWGNAEGRWEAGEENGRRWLDVVLYSGTERQINLAALQAAVIGLGVELTDGELSGEPLEGGIADNRMGLKWGGLSVEAPIRPDKGSALRSNTRIGK